MPEHEHSWNRRVLIAGCGFAGLATGRLLHAAGWQVVGLTQSHESAIALSGELFRIISADISVPAALANVAQEIGRFDMVVHSASSGRGGAEAYRRVYLEGARNLLDVFAPRQLLFTSSTSVYAQSDGSLVTEESAADPDRETGRLLRETEELVLQHRGIVARLAGIYGPGRSVLLRKFFSGEAVIEGDGSRWINQVHRDDIASGLLHLIEAGEAGVFNLSDDAPEQQRVIYEWLSRRFDRPLPASGPVDPNRKRGWTNKRVSNIKLRATGWRPRYPSFFAAVEHDAAVLHG
jgi:nucleoside-diphosphate-sugar epimerase